MCCAPSPVFWSSYLYHAVVLWYTRVRLRAWRRIVHVTLLCGVSLAFGRKISLSLSNLYPSMPQESNAYILCPAVACANAFSFCFGQGTVTDLDDVRKVFADGDITGVVVALGGKTKDVGKTMLTDGEGGGGQRKREAGRHKRALYSGSVCIQNGGHGRPNHEPYAAFGDSVFVNL